MKKIDWDNLEYYDFVGIVAGIALLIFCLYFGTLWYVTYDYRIETRDQMVETYQQLSDPIPSIKDDYEIGRASCRERIWLPGSRGYKWYICLYDRYGGKIYL